MATAFHASTPPPPEGPMRTPSTPRLGYSDNYEPYSPRRQSARVLQRARVAHTPPPRSSKMAATTSMSSPPPTSPQTASKKLPKKPANIDGGRRVSGALNYSNTASAAAALGLPAPPTKGEKEARKSTLIRNTGMLPTPDKTPKKRPSSAAPAITAVARTLFSNRGETVHEAMPSPKKKGRKNYTGFTLDSFGADEDGRGIQIYTDSHDRVPEADSSTDNPFYGLTTAAHPESARRTSKRRKITIPGEGELSLEEAEQREDGMVYVFRGKKMFKKFNIEGRDNEQLPDAEVDAGREQFSSSALHHPLTRSSIKPRLLFPNPQQVKAKEKNLQPSEDDEEAVTDIEELGTSIAAEQQHILATPKAPKFAPASPPTSNRATRSKDIEIISPAGPSNGDRPRRSGNISPFDSWQRTKGGDAGVTNKKRAGSPMRGGTKKARA